MSIPIISLILYVLTKYASKKPGRLLPIINKKKEERNENTYSDEFPDFGVVGYQPSVNNQSVFGSAITRGATGEQAEAFVSSTEMAHFAYAGTKHINLSIIDKNALNLFPDRYLTKFQNLSPLCYLLL